MAIPRFAIVTAAEAIGPDTRRLTLDLQGDEPLGFAGGQYIIVDTGLTAPTGKAIKRAYSILSPDGEQGRFTLATRLIPGGPGSAFMHELPLGAEVKFSGPWGKLRPADLPGRALVLATDTGVTAALGLVLGRPFAPLLPRTRFVWLRPDAGYFLPEAFVRAHLPPALGEVEIDVLPPIAHPERVARVRALLAGDLTRSPPLTQAFIAGDGAVNYALLDDLVAAGIPATRDHLESFFNMPKRDPKADPQASPAASSAKVEAA
jgi:ferredoxin-NADP reductase